MKKRILIIALTVAVLICSLFSLASCSSLEPEKAMEIFRAAYENTTTNWKDIYFYQEDIKEQASYDHEQDKPIPGYLINTSVNVHCDMKGNDYLLDSNYAAIISETFYSETMDAAEKLTTKYLGKNEINAVNTNTGTPALFVTRKEQKDEEEVLNYAQLNVKAKDFTASEYFSRFTLANKLSVLKDIQLEDITFVDVQDTANGAQQNFMTTKLAFKINDEFFAKHPECAILNGKYVYIEIVDINLGAATDYRIHNLYVYKTEKIGGYDSLELDYESYKLNISYLGPFTNTIDHEAKDGDKNVWSIQNDLYSNGTINAKYLFTPDFIKK